MTTVRLRSSPLSGTHVTTGCSPPTITGNLVILAAHIAGGGEAQIAPMLSVPVFIVMVGLTRLLAGGLASVGLASLLRTVHTALAFLLFATFIAHFSAALMHALIYRDGVFSSMASWKSLAGKSEDMTAPTIKRNAAK
jgi:hypothetical protein